MNYSKIRSLQGQLWATASLFVACVPIAIAVILCRGKFEQHMYEKYAANYANFDGGLKELIDHAETGVSPHEREALVNLTLPQKQQVYEDWMLRRDPPRPITPRMLVAADPDFYLGRAEQTVVCGDSVQRALALEFIQNSGSSLAWPRLDRLIRWAEQRQLPGLPEKILAVRNKPLPP